MAASFFNIVILIGMTACHYLKPLSCYGHIILIPLGFFSIIGIEATPSAKSPQQPSTYPANPDRREHHLEHSLAYHRHDHQRLH